MVALTTESALEKSILTFCKILNNVIVKHITLLVAASEIKKLEFLKEFRYEKAKERTLLLNPISTIIFSKP